MIQKRYDLISCSQLHVNQEEIDEDFASRCEESNLDINDVTLRRYSTSLLSRDQARINVVTEIINAERDYVKHLSDVVEVGLDLKCRCPFDMLFQWYY